MVLLLSFQQLPSCRILSQLMHCTLTLVWHGWQNLLAMPHIYSTICTEFLKHFAMNTIVYMPTTVSWIDSVFLVVRGMILNIELKICHIKCNVYVRSYRSKLINSITEKNDVTWCYLLHTDSPGIRSYDIHGMHGVNVWNSKLIFTILFFHYEGNLWFWQMLCNMYEKV